MNYVMIRAYVEPMSSQNFGRVSPAANRCKKWDVTYLIPLNRPANHKSQSSQALISGSHFHFVHFHIFSFTVLSRLFSLRQ